MLHNLGALVQYVKYIKLIDIINFTYKQGIP